MSKIINEIEETTISKKKQAIKELLSQCTEGQKTFFHRIYGEVDGIENERLNDAIKICERTIKKNDKSPIIEAKDR